MVEALGSSTGARHPDPRISNSMILIPNNVLFIEIIVVPRLIQCFKEPLFLRSVSNNQTSTGPVVMIAA